MSFLALAASELCDKRPVMGCPCWLWLLKAKVAVVRPHPCQHGARTCELLLRRPDLRDFAPLIATYPAEELQPTSLPSDLPATISLCPSANPDQSSFVSWGMCEPSANLTSNTNVPPRMDAKELASGCSTPPFCDGF